MLDYTLIRSSRRTLSLGIDRDGHIIVRAPLRYSVEKIESFMDDKIAWIEKNQEKIRDKQQADREMVGYYFLFSKSYTRGDLSDTQIIELSKETLRRYIDDRLPYLTEGKVFRKDIANIRISSARTRWGSCSSRGNLSFSYRLVAYPRETIDAVIIHELAHLNHANHSKRFWGQVYSWMPDYKERVKILKSSPQILES